MSKLVVVVWLRGRGGACRPILQITSMILTSCQTHSLLLNSVRDHVSSGIPWGGGGAAAKRFWGEGALLSHGLTRHPPKEMRWERGQNYFKEKCILMAKAKGNLVLLMKIPEYKRLGKRVSTGLR